MASSSKGHYGSAGAPGPMLPHDYGGNYQPQQQMQPAAPKLQGPKHASLTNLNSFGQQTKNVFCELTSGSACWWKRGLRRTTCFQVKHCRISPPTENKKETGD